MNRYYACPDKDIDTEEDSSAEGVFATEEEYTLLNEFRAAVENTKGAKLGKNWHPLPLQLFYADDEAEDALRCGFADKKLCIVKVEI